VQSFGGENLGSCRREDNIKTDLQLVGWGGVGWIFCVRIGRVNAVMDIQFT